MPNCNNCGAEVADVKFCPKCGQPVAGPADSGPTPGASFSAPSASAGASAGSTSGSAANDDNVMGALAYVTIIPAIIFLIIEPYKHNRFVRFHSFQCLFLAAALLALNVINIIIGFVPVVNFITILTVPALFIGGLVVWVIAVIKAYQGTEYRLPIIGDLAAKQV